MAAQTEKIAALYRTEHDRLARQIGRRTGDPGTALDIVHDVFLRLWERATDWNGEAPAYLTRCARNAAIDHLRAESTRNSFFRGILPEQYAAPAPLIEEVIAARQDIRNIDEALAGLPQRTRHIFLLNRIHGRSFTEIAAVMGISRQAVEKHMARAIVACANAR